MNYAEEIGKILINRDWKISTTESCTGGLLSSKLVDISGSSAYITLNLVTYSNEAKEKMLGVILDQDGAVSEKCSFQMAEGLYKLTNSDICVSTTGIAGPTGGTAEKPVGLMFSTIYTPKDFKTYKIQVDSNLSRIEIKERFTEEVLKNILETHNEFEFVTIQGETYGKSVQQRDYHMDNIDFKAFNLIFGYKDDTTKRLNPRKMTEILTNTYNIPCVPILDEHFKLPNSIDEMVAYADGDSIIDGDYREGVVLRTADGVNSFKAVSNYYLISKYGNNQ